MNEATLIILIPLAYIIGQITFYLILITYDWIKERLEKPIDVKKRNGCSSVMHTSVLMDCHDD